MKKSLLALAVLGVFAGEALAQSSSVTLFGVVDLSAQQIKNGNVNQKRMGADGINSNRLGFRGVEDLGGGMSAGFWLEAGMDPGLGTAGGSNGAPNQTNGASNLFNRRATVSLMGGWGEIRLGRDYTSGFWNTTIFDPFGTNGVGSFLNVSVNALGTNGGGTYVRANNIAAYFLPGNLGGLYGQAQIAPSEGNPGQKMQSFRLGYAAGPINVAVSTQQTEGSTLTTTGADWKHTNLAGSFNAGFATLMAQWDQQKGVGSRKQTTYLLGAVIPMGQGEIHVAYDNANPDGGTTAQNADSKQFALGYVYNLSKRSALYGTYSQIKNSTGAAAVVAGTNNGGSALSGKSTGFEVGMRHAF